MLTNTAALPCQAPRRKSLAPSSVSMSQRKRKRTFVHVEISVHSLHGVVGIATKSTNQVPKPDPDFEIWCVWYLRAHPHEVELLLITAFSAPFIQGLWTRYSKSNARRMKPVPLPRWLRFQAFVQAYSLFKLS